LIESLLAFLFGFINIMANIRLCSELHCVQTKNATFFLPQFSQMAKQIWINFFYKTYLKKLGYKCKLFEQNIAKNVPLLLTLLLFLTLVTARLYGVPGIVVVCLTVDRLTVTNVLWLSVR